MMMKFSSIGLRLSVTCALLGILLSRLDGGRLADILYHGSPTLFVLAVAALAATNFAIAWRWCLVLADRSQLRPSLLLRIVFVGCFFNQVLPTGIGGDAMRAWRCKLSGMDLTTAIAGILIDRVSGYIVLVAIYAAGMPALLAAIRDPLLRRLLLLVLGGAACGIAAFLVMDRLPRVLLRFRPVGFVADLSIAARRIFLDLPRALSIFALAAVATALTALSADLAGRCVGIDLSFSRWLIILPPVFLFQLLPVSLAGWGVREAVLVVLLGHLGIAAETALAASLCIGLSQILVGLPGGLIWLNNWDLGNRGGAADAVLTPPESLPRRGML